MAVSNKNFFFIYLLVSRQNFWLSLMKSALNLPDAADKKMKTTSEMWFG